MQKPSWFAVSEPLSFYQKGFLFTKTAKLQKNPLNSRGFTHSGATGVDRSLGVWFGFRKTPSIICC
jgi:hypothetical protein